MENRDAKRIYAMELLSLLENGTDEYNKLYKFNQNFKSDIDLLKLRLNLIIDEKERADYDEVDYKGYKNGKFIVNLYDPNWVSYDDGYWNWDYKARETIFEVAEDLSKINVYMGHRLDEYELKSKTLRK